MKSKKDIKKLYFDGKLHEVMRALEERLAVEDSDKQRRITTLLSRYHSLERNHQLGAVEVNDYREELNRLRLSTYEVIRTLKDINILEEQAPASAIRPLAQRVSTRAPVAPKQEQPAPAPRRPTDRPARPTVPSEPGKTDSAASGAHLFISYAREDREFVDELIVALASLRAKGWISSWTDSDIRGGDEWRPAIETNLRRADIIIYVVSPDFLNSTFIRNTEMIWAEEERTRRGATILPVIARPSTWKLEDFSKYNVVPRTDAGVSPISRWEDEDEAYLTVVMELIELVKRVISNNA